VFHFLIGLSFSQSILSWDRIFIQLGVQVHKSSILYTHADVLKYAHELVHDSINNTCLKTDHVQSEISTVHQPFVNIQSSAIDADHVNIIHVFEKYASFSNKIQFEEIKSHTHCVKTQLEVDHVDE
jgi:hypothetical protein